MQNSPHIGVLPVPRVLLLTPKIFFLGLKQQTAFYSSTQVAFSARLTIGQTPSMSPNQDIVFNDVLLNVGSAYHNTHGTFVAPVSGFLINEYEDISNGSF